MIFGLPRTGVELLERQWGMCRMGPIERSALTGGRYSGSILIVEDQPDTVRLLSRMLSDAEHSLNIAPSGALAIGWLEKNQPDLILLDIHLPDIEGYEICRQLKKTPGLASIPVIFISALDDAAGKVKAFEVGGVDYITKPFQELEVLERVKTHIKLHRTTRALQNTSDQLEERVQERTMELQALNIELQKNEAKYRRLVESLEREYFVYSQSAGGEMTYVSPSISNVLGFSEKDFRENYFRMVTANPANKEAVACIRNSRNGQRQPPYEIEINHSSGRLCCIEVLETPISEGGKVIAVEGIAHDITERKSAEEELRMTSSVFSNSTEAIMITSAEGRIIRVNQSFVDITGFSAAQVVGKNVEKFRSERQAEAFYAGVTAELMENNLWEGEMWKTRSNGEEYLVWNRVMSVKNSLGKTVQYISIFSDITESKRSQERIRYLAHYDVLTDLPNRQLFSERCQQALADARRHLTKVGIVFMDLDNFKLINDSMGHQIGDKVLQAVAQRISQVIRAGDTLARLGGDEFILLFKDIGDEETISRVVEKIGGEFDHPFEIGNSKLRITMSIGISVCPDDGRDADTLIKNADAAMYQAKLSGRSIYRFYTPEMTQNAQRRIQLENELYRALENSEFRVFYQPQYSLKEKTLVGAEALIRWQHPSKGLLTPEKFLPVAEESRLIVHIGEWVIDQVCRKIRHWMCEEYDIPAISVNIAGVQLSNGGLFDVIKAAIEKHEIKPELLKLEITEGLIMNPTSGNGDPVITQLNALRDLGVSIAIDDFGTGYSSLSYLKRLPIDTLKIDQSFIDGVDENADNKAITQAVIALGKTLKLAVIAEGVESIEQKRHLRAMGCDEAQGYYFSYPLEEEGFTQLMTNTTT